VKPSSPSRRARSCTTQSGLHARGHAERDASESHGRGFVASRAQRRRLLVSSGPAPEIGESWRGSRSTPVPASLHREHPDRRIGERSTTCWGPKLSRRSVWRGLLGPVPAGDEDAAAPGVGPPCDEPSAVVVTAEFRRRLWLDVPVPRCSAVLVRQLSPAAGHRSLPIRRADQARLLPQRTMRPNPIQAFQTDREIQ
jgi:hypothetical protein